MSSSKLSRALLALGALLGAVPLIAQRPASSVPQTFPLGQYLLLTDSQQPAGNGQTIAFSTSSATMSVNGQVVKVRGFAIHDRSVEIYDLQGQCTSPSTYQWSLAGDVLTLALQSDPCGDPSHAGRSLTLRKIAGTGAAPAPAPERVFPYGKYALVGIDSVNGPPPGMFVEFTTSRLDVIRDGQVIETHGLSVIGPILETFTLGGECTDPGTYNWHIDGKVLTLSVIQDPCTNRAMSIAAVSFVQQ